MYKRENHQHYRGSKSEKMVGAEYLNYFSLDGVDICNTASFASEGVGGSHEREMSRCRQEGFDSNERHRLKLSHLAF